MSNFDQLSVSILSFVLSLYLGFLFVLRNRFESIENIENSRTGRTYAFVITITILVGAILRLHLLGSQLWFDEMLTQVNIMPMSIVKIVSTFEDANNHVLYSVLAKISEGILGPTNFAFRLPAAIFGIAGIWAVYALGRRVVSAQESIAAAALLALSYHHIWFSQNARGYTALLFFSMLSTMKFFDGLRSPSTKNWLLYAFAAFLGAYTHLSIGFLLVAQFGCFLWVSAKVKWSDTVRTSLFAVGILYGYALLGLLLALSYSTVIDDMFSGALLGSGLQEHSDWTNPIWAARELITSLQLGFSGAGALILAGMVFLVGSIDLARLAPKLVFIFIASTGLAALALASIGYTLFPRFFFFSMGFGVLILVHGSWQIGQFLQRWLLPSAGSGQFLKVLPVAILLATSIFPLKRVYNPKQSFLEAMSYVEEHRHEQDKVVVLGIADFPINKFYHKGWPKVSSMDEYMALVKPGIRTWLLYTMPVHARTAYPDVIRCMAKDFDLAKTFWGTLGGGQILVMASKDQMGCRDTTKEG